MPEYTALADEGIGPQCYLVDANTNVGEDFATKYGSRDIMLMRSKRHTREVGFGFSNGPVVVADVASDEDYGLMPNGTLIFNGEGSPTGTELLFIKSRTGAYMRAISTENELS